MEEEPIEFRDSITMIFKELKKQQTLLENIIEQKDNIISAQGNEIVRLQQLCKIKDHELRLSTLSVESQKKKLFETPILEKGIPKIPLKEQSSSSDELPLEVIQNNSFLENLTSQTGDFKESIDRNQVFVYKSTFTELKMSVKELLGKLIGRRGNTRHGEYKQVIMSILKCSDKDISFWLDIKNLKGTTGISYIVFIINVNININYVQQAEIRQQLKLKIIDIINRPLINDFPLLTIFPNDSYIDKDILLEKLNSEFNLLKVRSILIEKYDVQDYNLISLQFSSIEDFKEPPKTSFKVKLSLQVKIFVYRDYQAIKNKTDTLHELLVEKELNMFHYLKRDIQEIVNTI